VKYLVSLTQLQKLRLLQAFFASVLTLLSSTLLTTFRLPDPPPIDVFLSKTDLLKYNFIQFIFLISFISAAALFGMAYQAKDIEKWEE
jgi:hypothetical protein